MPKKLLTVPDEKAFNTKKSEMEKSVKEIADSIGERKTLFDDKVDEKRTSLKAASDDKPVPTKDLTAKFNRMKELKKQREEIYANQEAATKDQGKLISERDFLMKKIDKFYNKEELIPKGI